MPRWMIVLAVVALVTACTASAAPTERTYLPFVSREPSLIGQTVAFSGWSYAAPAPRAVPMRLVVTAVERRAELATDRCVSGYPGPAPTAPTVRALGVFVVVLADVANDGLVSAGGLPDLAMGDTDGRRFDAASSLAQCAAQAVYGRPMYPVIQPGFTVPAVLVYDVLPTSTGLYLVDGSPLPTATPLAMPAPPGASVIMGGRGRLANVRATSFTILWTSDADTAGQVHFGPTASLGSTAPDVRGAVSAQTQLPQEVVPVAAIDSDLIAITGGKLAIIECKESGASLTAEQTDDLVVVANHLGTDRLIFMTTSTFGAARGTIEDARARCSATVEIWERDDVFDAIGRYVGEGEEARPDPATWPTTYLEELANLLTSDDASA